ncbi:uncharacterized protein sb:cb1058 [Synchiropus splendidus]|uniref:uncharacterized protein sb:cb1058 n=1 Tax=Synchiropus splendidus TaxID=270530 RepID=UPI00237D693D|nr:uncharacterized protein sb:cb1058 [Synchiropus splendidus]
MTIGKSSRRSSTRSSIRAPKFLDKSSGLYGRLDEPAGEGEVTSRMEGGQATETPAQVHVPVREVDVEAFDSMMEDDCETLLRRKPSRLSSRWRRSSRRKQREEEREDELEPKDKKPSLESEAKQDVKVAEDKRDTHVVVHFQIREDADDQVLIRDKNTREDEQTEEERRMKKEQEDGVKAVKKISAKNYRKALDRALRRGWESFITNLYSVTLTPVTSSSSSPSPSSKQSHHQQALADFQ